MNRLLRSPGVPVGDRFEGSGRVNLRRSRGLSNVRQVAPLPVSPVSLVVVLTALVRLPLVTSAVPVVCSPRQRCGGNGTRRSTLARSTIKQKSELRNCSRLTILKAFRCRIRPGCFFRSFSPVRSWPPHRLCSGGSSCRRLQDLRGRCPDQDQGRHYPSEESGRWSRPCQGPEVQEAPCW